MAICGNLRIYHKMQWRGGSKGHRWVENPNPNTRSTSYSMSDGIPSATTENITDSLNALDVAEKNEQSGASEPSMQFGNIGLMSHVPLHGNKLYGSPRHMEQVSEASTTEVNKAPIDTMSILANETRTTSTEKTVAGFSKLFGGSLLENFTVDNSACSYAQVGATFYPKFENEKFDQEISTRIIEMVTKGLATLEVSLKHLGSLFMHAVHKGGGYAKNSYGDM